MKNVIGPPEQVTPVRRMWLEYNHRGGIGVYIKEGHARAFVVFSISSTGQFYWFGATELTTLTTLSPMEESAQ